MKDPAALLYIDKWLVSTKGMKASARGWYLNLILHQYDKGSLPNNIEDLADFADVKHSEFEEFKQVFEQVLKQKFVENSEGRLINEFAQEIIIKRESFKDKRSESGKWSYILKYIRKNHLNNKDFELFLKENIDLNFDTKNEQVLEQVFKQNYELYINENEDKDINIDLSKKENQNFKNSNKLEFTFSECIQELRNSDNFKIECERILKINRNKFDEYLDHFNFHNKPTDETLIFEFDKVRSHFSNWLKNNKDKLPQSTQQTTNKTIIIPPK